MSSNATESFFICVSVIDPIKMRDDELMSSVNADILKLGFYRTQPRHR